MAISHPKPDILIRNPEGQPVAVVEVKNIQNLSRDEAMELRRDLVSYGVPSQVPYFLLLSQDIGYLWKESRLDTINTPPTYEFPMDGVISRYSERKPGQRLYATELELLILQWLTNLSTKPQKNTEEPESTLARAGFSDSIKGSLVLIEDDGL